MTILDASHSLFDYFRGNHHFSIKKNFKDVVPISEEEELEKATIGIALRELEKNEIVKSTEIEGEKYYILNRPMESFEQSVELSYPTAFLISNALNEFCDTIGDYSDASDVSQITEKDIRNLVILNQHYKTELAKLIGESSSGKFGDDINFENL